jgi:SAM-dependent methyltransferase
MDERAKSIEAENRAKFTGGFYQPSTISTDASQRTDNYPSRMMAIKLGLIREWCQGPRLLDVCCSTGLQLKELAAGRRLALGLDYSMPFLANAAAANAGNAVAVVCANARALPVLSNAVDGAYSISSLYVIPDVDEVIEEMARVLKPGGRCLLDLGNVDSLNHVVCLAYPELAAPCHISVARMREIIAGAGMKIVVHRSFQLLPMWGDRPRWLKWLMAPRMIRFLMTTLRGRMLDEWISSLPFTRRYAFRQVIVCEKL